MNQDNSIKRTAISFGLAIFIALLAISIQGNMNQETNILDAEAKVYPEKSELLAK